MSGLKNFLDALVLRFGFNHVPKMIAAALISKNPGRYGFSHVKYEEPIPFEEVPIETPIDLRVAAQCAEASY